MKAANDSTSGNNQNNPSPLSRLAVDDPDGNGRKSSGANILFFSHYFPPEGNAPATRVYEITRRWVRAGHNVKVITCAPNVPAGKVYEGYKNKLLHRSEVEGVEVVRVWTYIAANKGTLLRILNFVSYMVSAVFFAMFMKKPDVIIATSPQFFCGWAGLIVSKLRGVPFILEIRDIWPESIVAVGAMGNKRLLRILEWMEAKMYAWSEQIVTVGEGYRRRLMEKGVSPEKISVIMNGVDREKFSPRKPDKELRAKFGLDGQFVCSYVGTIGMACGLDVVLRAGEMLKRKQRTDIAFLFVGDGAVKEDLEREVRERGLEKQVFFTGLQDKSMIPDLLAVSDACLVHLKKRELFSTVMPSKIFEAAGMARPIINGVQGFASEFVEKAGAGICIEPENEAELVQAVEKLADNPMLRITMGRSGHDYVVQNYNRDQLAEDYLHLIGKVYGKKVRRFAQEAKTAGLGRKGYRAPELLPLQRPAPALRSFSFIPRISRLGLQRLAGLACIIAATAALYIWGSAVGRVSTAPFQAMWAGGLGTAAHNLSVSGSFWAILVGSFAATSLLTPLAMLFARRIGAVDRGGHRKIDRKAMPLLGGIAVAFPFLVVCGMGLLGPTDLFRQLIAKHVHLWALLIGCVYILGIGVVDDTRGLRAKHKFFLEVAVALFLCFCGFSIHRLTVPFVGVIELGTVLGAAITILWVVGLTNAVNIIDGLDGLASGVTLIAAVGLGFIAAMNGAMFAVLLCTALAGSLAAFLLFNFHPARIFLGDTGSLFLGFALASISLTGSMKATGAVIFLAPMLALGLPLFEVGLSMLRRFVRGLPIAGADASHLHHRLLRRGFSQRRVAFVMYGASFICMVAALLTATLSSQNPWGMLLPLGMYCLTMLAIGLLAGYPRDLGQALDIRKRNVFYQALVNYTSASLSSDVGVLNADAALAVTRAEMRLRFLSVSFLEPLQPIGCSWAAKEAGNGAAMDPVQEVHVKAANGQHILVRYQHEGYPAKEEREEIRNHLGRMLEQTSVKRPAGATEPESARVGRGEIIFQGKRSFLFRPKPEPGSAMREITVGASTFGQ